MRIGIQTWGSEGDVRPFLALAAGLTRAGHEVSVAISHVENRDYADYGRNFAFSVRAAGMLDPGALNSADDLLRSASNPVAQFKVIRQCLYAPFGAAMREAAHELCRQNDLVISHFMLHQLLAVAEARKRPCVSVFTAPVLPASSLAPGGVVLPLPFLNRLAWRLADGIISRLYLPGVNEVRAAEGLRPLRSTLSEAFCSKFLNLVEVSPTLFAPPPDWDGLVHVCGAFTVPEQGEQWLMPGALQRFLDAGPPPVYMTFGSMSAAGRTFEESLALLSRAALAAGVRAVIQTGGARTAVSSPDLYYLDRAPHHRLFPRCAAVVHHGGAGTTHSASRAGLPSIIVEHVMDQAFWGAVLFRKGIAPRMLHRRTLTVSRLARALRKVLSSPAMGEKARQAGESMQREDGVQRAVALIEERFARSS